MVRSCCGPDCLVSTVAKDPLTLARVDNRQGSQNCLVNAVVWQNRLFNEQGLSLRVGSTNLVGRTVCLEFCRRLL